MSIFYVIDCAKSSSEDKCDLKIMGTDKDAVVEAAFQHALGSVHQHDAEEPGLREMIESLVEKKEAKRADADPIRDIPA